ncbi:hypothetical protein [Sansalvadorimonas verongulae]|uniref:hypothetical protein n=1 Tax=Sansalvadorimonas verongulae TaxID=2172824 RepID=UPI0012BC3F12|nr:hypothetical protein [Sansalvadorimonas verongulae]MTI12129.1 hypothetical protein [Sansalvadorimonas verongulae]
MENSEEVDKSFLPEELRHLDIAHRGSRYTVLYCEGAKDTYESALGHIPKGRQSSIKARLRALLKRLSDGNRLSQDNFPQEANLPGKGNGRFRALKKIPIRVYMWLSKRYPSIYFISHCIFKNKNELAEADKKIVCNNWRKLEEG